MYEAGEKRSHKWDGVATYLIVYCSVENTQTSVLNLNYTQYGRVREHCVE